MTATADPLTGERVIVTGGAGSVGIELINQLLARPVELVRVIDNNESAVFGLQEQIGNTARCELLFSDIRDEHELYRVFSGVNVCIHAAALKHVPSCELSPASAVQTNIIGTQQVIRAALRNGLSHVLFTSSDKAVNPTSVMGTSKLMAERLITAANALSEGSHRCVFSSTRFGNVAGSRGSVIPLFCEQLRAGRDLNLTDPGMTRFIMTLQSAARLLLQSLSLSRGGEIFITKMPVVMIAELARVMIRLVAPVFGRNPANVAVRNIGPRPGEKLWEELNTDEEARRTYDLGDYLVVLPALRNFYSAVNYEYDGVPLVDCNKTYHSANEPVMSEREIEEFLIQPGVLPDFVRARLGLAERGME
jgi:FlaA1/EpsC-like NDP-sugar epimerase